MPPEQAREDQTPHEKGHTHRQGCKIEMGKTTDCIALNGSAHKREDKGLRERS